MNKFCAILLLLIVNSACKGNTEESVKDTNEQEITSQKHLTITFNFKTDKADVFKIMMNNIVIDELQKKNIHIFENVKPTLEEDTITAEFDTNNISNHILINLGTKELKNVEIISILVSYGGNSYTIDSTKDIKKYFAFNRFVETDEDNRILTTKKVDGKHNPAITLRRNLINLLKKE